MLTPRRATFGGRLLVALALSGCASHPGTTKGEVPTTTPPDTLTSEPTVPTDGDDCLTDEEQFARDVSPLLQADCIACHQAGSIADGTRHVLLPDSEADHLAHNFGVLVPLALETVDDLPLVVAKALGEASHGGGARLVLSDPDTVALQAFAARAEAPGGCDDPTDDPLQLDVPASPVRRLTPTQLQNTYADLFPGVSVEGLVAVQADPVVHGFDNNAETQAATALQVGQLHDAAFAVAEAAMADPVWLGCDLSDTPCVHGFLDDFGSRAFRRPLHADELDTYVGFYDELLAEDGDPAAALQLTLQAFLESPSLLYLVEFGASDLTAPGERVALTDYEVASRLSYFLWNTLPDDTLFAAAAAGELATPQGVEAQAWRMLEDDRATQAVANFHRLWLELEEVDHIAPDLATYPQWDPTSYPSLLRAELDDLVLHSAFGPDPTLSTLLLSPRTTVGDAGLAQIYGFVPDGSGVSQLPTSERAGVLTRMGWLGATSHAVFGSPIQRGVFVLERLMCIPPPAPPADVDTDIPDDDELGPIVTNRDRYEQHSTDPACFGCHESIDGIGFGFEHYDAIGAYRDLDNGAPVDATGGFVDGDLSGVPYDGALEMSQLLASSETVHRCAVTQWYRYALGRSEQLGDQPTLDDLTAAYWGTGGELPQLLVDLALTDSFRTRRAE